jgi:hypothetical protein
MTCGTSWHRQQVRAARQAAGAHIKYSRQYHIAWHAEHKLTGSLPALAVVGWGLGGSVPKWGCLLCFAGAAAKADSLEGSLNSSKDQLLRLTADFENFRKRTVRLQLLGILLEPRILDRRLVACPFSVSAVYQYASTLLHQATAYVTVQGRWIPRSVRHMHCRGSKT